LFEDEILLQYYDIFTPVMLEINHGAGVKFSNKRQFEKNIILEQPFGNNRLY